MRAQEFLIEYREPKSQRAHRGGIDLEAWRDGLHFQINATSHGRDLGRVVFDVQFQGNDTILVAQDLMIHPEYRGQGIATIMYDYAKELGYVVERSGQQTDAGAAFWQRHRPGQNVWEQKLTTAKQVLELDPWTFDQTDQGWRSLSQPRAIAALRDYVSKYVRQGQFVNAPKGNKVLLPNTLYWHLGQLQAMAGDSASAVASMRSSLSGDPDWDAYVRATIAFLANNRKAFDQYVGQPNSNKETIDRLAANWGKSYNQAY